MSDRLEDVVRENFCKLLGDTPISTMRFDDLYNPVYKMAYGGKRARVQELLREAIDVFVSTRTVEAVLTVQERRRVVALKDTCLAYNNVANAAGLLTVTQLLNERLGYDVFAVAPTPRQAATTPSHDQYASD